MRLKGKENLENVSLLVALIMVNEYLIKYKKRRKHVSFKKQHLTSFYLKKAFYDEHENCKTPV